MKPLYSLLLSATLAGTISLGMAQSRPTPPRPTHQLFKRSAHPAPLPRAPHRPQAAGLAGIVVEHQWDPNAGVWSNGIRTAFTYDGQGRILETVRTDTATSQVLDKQIYTLSAQGFLTQRLTQRYDNAARTFVDEARELIAYNAAGLDTLRLAQRYDLQTATFVDERRERKRYNAAGLDTLSLTQLYDAQAGAFVNEQRLRQRYDARNNPSLYLYQTWDTGRSAWQTRSGSRTASVYNATGGLLQETTDYYDNLTGSFEPDQQFNYLLNARNEPTAAVYAGWDEVARTFVNRLRFHNIVWYDFSREQVAYAESQQWEPTTATWLNSERSTGVYQLNGSSVVIIQEFVAAPDVYRNASRETETYDNIGNLLLTRYEEWDNGQWEVQNEGRALIAYTPDNQVRRLVLQQLDLTTNQYENLALTRYDNFSPVTKAQPATKLAAATAVFPNPAPGNTVTVRLSSLPTAAPVPTELYNSLGQVVRTFSLQPRQGRIEQELNLTGLPAGLYILRLHPGSESISQRIVKQ
ncbi:T9SS type A sorting domain-containing protein [Hymenobacter rubripertinctus]|uniref:T9SS C-terminal target domain-containing protein n=1 Tax=Hymenobacter rubripertinctus TaxID=2029981 RepID=A0A418QWK3_9BACT|nr:T9SS type A sorting domain-containing protein [Hymenobacter rubripertinctus]RIY09543.1 T9SS C-terminal target domain-containing protein [Hymenobacter rubripertinctus]